MKFTHGMLAVVLVAGVCLSGGLVRAEEKSAAPLFVVTLAKFNDSVIDAALDKLAKTTEIAVVQEGKLKDLSEKTAKKDHAARQQAEADVKKLQAGLEEAQKKSPDAAETKALAEQLAAKKQELSGIVFGVREQLFCDILELLYPDQAGAFQASYESSLDPADGVPRKKARDRMQFVFGRIELTTVQRKEIAVALMKYYASTMAGETALEASYKDRLADKAVAEEYRQKYEAFLRPIRAKTMEIAKSLLSEDRQKEVDSEWKRRQERRIGMTLKDLSFEIYGTNPEQKKQVEALHAGFRDAAKDLDLESSDYGVLVEKLRADLSTALNKK